MAQSTSESVKKEYRKWLRRQKHLQEVLERLERDEAYLLGEMEKLDQQLSYYDSLMRDMKKETQPPRLSRLLRSWEKR